jgi:hypothetical protein
MIFLIHHYPDISGYWIFWSKNERKRERVKVFVYNSKYSWPYVYTHIYTHIHIYTIIGGLSQNSYRKKSSQELLQLMEEKIDDFPHERTGHVRKDSLNYVSSFMLFLYLYLVENWLFIMEWLGMYAWFL